MTLEPDERRRRGRARMAAHRARLAADGYLFVRGEPVRRARRNRRPGEEPPHGTEARYVWTFGPCRCRPCRDAYATAQRERRARRRARQAEQ